MNDCSVTFQKYPRRARSGAMLRKMSISRIGKYVHMVGNISTYIKFSALRAIGGDVEIFRTKILGGDRDEKIDFRIISRAP